MLSKLITAILAAAILFSASGTVGPFYFVSSQGQITTEPAELSLSESEASPGSVVEVEGSNFGANSQVSIYFMLARPVDLTDGSAFILQGIDANQGTTTEPEGNGTFLGADDAAPTLEDLLELRTNQGGNDTTITTNATNISEQNLVVALEEGGPMNGTMSLECEDATIAEGRINGTIGTFAASPGTYNECSISISDGNIINTGDIDDLIVASEDDYQNSLVTSESADEEGTFVSAVTVPDVEEGEYAILAVADDTRAAASALSVTVAESVTERANATSAANATEDIRNETITQAPEEEAAEEESTELLTAGIISNGTQGVAPATFEFQANLTGGTEPYTYSWNFDDDSEESNDQTVLHTFEEAGTYNVTLVAIDTDNQNTSESIEINVEEPAEGGGGEAATTTVQNQTQNNQTDTDIEEPTVQLDETSVEPGSPLPISGEGFQPNTPIQIFINNVQIKNAITNVEGSFNTLVIVPTTVVAGSAQVVVRTPETNIIQNVNIIELDGTTEGPSTLRLTAASATDNGEALRNAPVTIFDTSSGQVIEKGKTPMDIELQEGT